ncbi:hypothetical protein B1U44_29965 (plasmid) [Klebsiella pneumoniae subsp. pneumoniae]|nr:hypothetical protein B1U44_29965 [Klebsiella pneumoniae subsp. pneumoniae]
MNIYCDDGSTNVKLAWFEGDELQTRVSANSFRHGWKVAEFSAATFNYPQLARSANNGWACGGSSFPVLKSCSFIFPPDV